MFVNVILTYTYERNTHKVEIVSKCDCCNNFKNMGNEWKEVSLLNS